MVAHAVVAEDDALRAEWSGTPLVAWQHTSRRATEATSTYTLGQDSSAARWRSSCPRRKRSALWLIWSGTR